jgi:hypothetical protein
VAAPAFNRREGEMRVAPKPRLTERINLPGGQDRLRQLILYVSGRCASAERFGLTKLNKTLWKADFDAFATRKRPITGRAYQRLDLGPAPKEMPRVLNDLLRDDAIELVETDFGEGIVEKRPIPHTKPNMAYFDEEDLSFVEAAISYYWDKTGIETSDDSHGVAWRSRPNGTPMFYELSYLSDVEISPRQRARMLQRAREMKWQSR